MSKTLNKYLKIIDTLLDSGKLNTSSAYIREEYMSNYGTLVLGINAYKIRKDTLSKILELYNTERESLCGTSKYHILNKKQDEV